MKSTTNIWLVRHGCIALPPTKIFVGQTNLPLNHTGRKQMQALQDFFIQENLDAVLCSDLERSQESAALLCPPQVPLIVEKDFREIHLGIFEGRSVAEIQREYTEEYVARGAYIHSFRPEQGESFEDLDARVHTALAKHLQTYTTKNIAIVAHAGVNRVILARYMSLPLKYVLDIPQPYGCCTLLQLIDIV